jgi:hypothetical protein
MSFFQYPSAKREMNAHRLPLAEAIRAYEAIGYECVALDVQEKPNDKAQPDAQGSSRGSAGAAG